MENDVGAEIEPTDASSFQNSEDNLDEGATVVDEIDDSNHLYENANTSAEIKKSECNDHAYQNVFMGNNSDKRQEEKEETIEHSEDHEKVTDHSTQGPGKIKENGSDNNVDGADATVDDGEITIRLREDKTDDVQRSENPMFHSVLALRPADSTRSPFFKRKEKKQADLLGPNVGGEIGFHRSGGFRGPSPLPHVPEIEKVDPYAQWPRLLTWFLGPKAENEDAFVDLATAAIKRHCQARRNYFRTDPVVITDELKEEIAYKAGIEQQKKELERISRLLEQSVPTFSPRYQGHMLWDTCMPANLGYLQAFLYNQNNVALEASPVTTKLEVEVGKQLCEMLFGTWKKLNPKKNSLTENSDIKAWGHLTSGGSLANIESLWAARNTKFVPLALRKAISDIPELKGAKGFMVYNSRKEKMFRLLDSWNTTNWELLNMDVDEIINMPSEVAKMADCTESFVMEAIQQYSVSHLGMYGLMKKFGLKKTPVVISPATNHYSWPKAANVLGIGIENIKFVGVDERFRMDMDDLERILRDCEETKTPVITVVCVIGTTEESAVDPLSEVLELRETMKKKGLNFTINADAAWGGYFMTMLSRQSTIMEKKDNESYVPSCALSIHTIKQLEKLHLADTVTVDPHKSGFIPYSAGALCYRNGNMRKFVKMDACVIAHDEGDTAIGICCLEGSRPGAAAAGVITAHNTIGLNADGYGRILGQCTFGAKLFYCRWITLAKDEDNFMIVPMKNIPKDFDLNETKETINTMIFAKDVRNENILKMSAVRRILRYIGPDMLITAFAVNIKDNHDVELCNKLNKLIFNMLSHSGQHADVDRVPLILTQSEISPVTAPKVVHQFKERLGLFSYTKENVHFLINTVMNPWVGTPQMVSKLGNVFRQTVLTAIGTLTDPKDVFCFVCAGSFHGEESDEIFAELRPSFSRKSYQYQAVVKFKVCGDIENDIKNRFPGKPILLKSLKKITLGYLIEQGNTFDADIEIPTLAEETSSDSVQMRTVRQTVKVVDVLLFNHFDLNRQHYHKAMTYFLYGSKQEVFMTHIISHAPDFFQMIKLDQGHPAEVDIDFRHQGIMVKIEDLPGDPWLDYSNTGLLDPLTKEEYIIDFSGDNNTSRKSTIRKANKNARIFFEMLGEDSEC